MNGTRKNVYHFVVVPNNCSPSPLCRYRIRRENTTSSFL